MSPANRRNAKESQIEAEVSVLHLRRALFYDSEQVIVGLSET